MHCREDDQIIEQSVLTQLIHDADNVLKGPSCTHDQSKMKSTPGLAGSETFLPCFNGRENLEKNQNLYQNIASIV